jgi:hypothetical protein
LPQTVFFYHCFLFGAKEKEAKYLGVFRNVADQMEELLFSCKSIVLSCWTPPVQVFWWAELPSHFVSRNIGFSTSAVSVQPQLTWSQE